MKRILLVIDTLKMGGAPHQALTLINALEIKGYSPIVICLSSRGSKPLLQSISSNVSIIFISKASIIFGYGWLKFLLLLWKNRQSEAILSFLSFSAILTPVPARIFGYKKIIASVRGENMHQLFLLKKIQSWSMRFADKVIVNSKFLREVCIKKYNVPTQKLAIIPNGISPLIQSASLKKKSLGKHPLRLGSIGRLEFVKGYDVLLKALPLLEDKQATVRIIGSGTQKAVLEALANSLNIANRVRFTESLKKEEIIDFLREIDIYIQPSRTEGMSNAILEAMSLGCTILGSNVPGNAELLQNENFGYLFKSENSQDLAKKIHYILQDKAVEIKANRAKEYVESHYSMDHITKQWLHEISGIAC